MANNELKPSDYREIRQYLREQETVEDLEIKRRMIDLQTYEGLYLRFTCSKAGINLWDLHDEFDVDVVFSWKDPTIDRLSMGLRLRE